METSFNIMELATAIIAVIVLITWFVAFKHILKISAFLNGKDTIAGCIEEANVALFSGDKPTALKLYYRALYIDWQNHPIRDMYETKDAEIAQELKDKYLSKIEECGGKWPQELE